jgi:hypothetical protein
MLHTPVHWYLYGMAFMFICEVQAWWTHIYKWFLLAQSPMVGFLDCWRYYWIYLLVCGTQMIVPVSKLNNHISEYCRVLSNIWGYQAWKVWQHNHLIYFKSCSKASSPSFFADSTPCTWFLVEWEAVPVSILHGEFLWLTNRIWWLWGTMPKLQTGNTECVSKYSSECWCDWGWWYLEKCSRRPSLTYSR